MSDSKRQGAVRRFFGWLFSPSAHWSVIALLLLGLLIGFAATVGTQVAVAWSGTNEFCGSACHSHALSVYPEYKASVHGSNRTGVQAKCSDCHIPHSYPTVLFYKAKAGIRDAVAEVQGVISTKEKFEKERWRLASHVWEEMRADNSANCRTCHNPDAWDEAKQGKSVVKQHKKFKSGEATCIDCHTGVAHAEPKDPASAKPAPSAESAAPAASAADGAASAAASAAPKS